MSARRVAFATLVVGVAPSALAAGGGGTWLGLPVWIFLSINLAIFLGAIFKFAVPKILAFLDARSVAIRESLELARQQESQVAGLEARLSGAIAELEREIAELSAKGDADARREREEILASAEVERQRVLDQANAEMDHRIEQARAELTRHAAALAAELAARKLEGELDDATRRRLFDDGVAGLERKSA